MNTLDKAIQWLEKSLIAVAFCVMVILTFSQVLARFVFNDPISWSEEIARFLFVWITMLGASHAVAHHKHFCVDFLVGRFSVAAQKKFWLVTAVCVSLFAGIMIYYGGFVANFVRMQTSPALLISMSLPYLCIPLAGLFMILHIACAWWTGSDAMIVTAEATVEAALKEGGAE